MSVGGMVAAEWIDSLGPVITTLGGVAAGLLAPFVSQRAHGRAARRESQAELARSALVLFEGDSSLEALLCGPTSPTRRRLFLLASQLRDDSARVACIGLVATAGAPDVDADALTEHWGRCVDELGRLARSG
jgi:hypothetical protein